MKEKGGGVNLKQGAEFRERDKEERREGQLESDCNV